MSFRSNGQIIIEKWTVQEELILEKILAEIQKAQAKFYSFHSMHEGFAVLKEEIDELWNEVKANNYEGARKEAIQIAAMAIRFIIDCEKNPLGLRINENGL